MAEWKNKPEEKQQEFEVTASREEMTFLIKLIGGQSIHSWQKLGLSEKAARGFDSLYDQLNIEFEEELNKLKDFNIEGVSA